MTSGFLLTCLILGLGVFNFGKGCECDVFDVETSYCIYDVAIEALITKKDNKPEKYTFTTLTEFLNLSSKTTNVMLPAGDCGMDAEVDMKYIAFGNIIRDDDGSNVLITSCRYGSVSESNPNYSNTRQLLFKTLIDPWC